MVLCSNESKLSLTASQYILHSKLFNGRHGNIAHTYSYQQQRSSCQKYVLANLSDLSNSSFFVCDVI